VNNLKTHLICLECPNGCNLRLDWKTDTSVSISENKCAKGIIFASRILKKEKQAHITVDACSKHLSKEILSKIISFWDIEIDRLRYDIDIQGSPERTVFRVVVEDKKNNLYLLEEIEQKTLLKKQKIVKSLEFLSDKDLKYVQPYFKNRNEDYIISQEGRLWQMIKFVPSVRLNRREYMYDEWRGDVLADFLIDLKTKSKELVFFREEKAFSIKKYIYRLVQKIESYCPEAKKDVDFVVNFLDKDFMNIHDELPVCFCHGDFHPMNIVWGQKKIEYVIDWEFLGIKPEIYDMCNLIGCVGIEHPSSLYEGLILPFVRKIKAAKIFSNISFEYLIEFIIALRFAWLSEWLRREDEDMIDLELTYMKLLIEQKEDIKKAWGL